MRTKRVVDSKIDAEFVLGVYVPEEDAWYGLDDLPSDQLAEILGTNPYLVDMLQEAFATLITGIKKDLVDIWNRMDKNGLE